MIRSLLLTSILAAFLGAICMSFLVAADSPLPRGGRIEVRRCHPVGDEDESQKELTCSCQVANWVRDGEGWILVCKGE